MSDPRNPAGASREVSSDDGARASAPDKTYRPAEIEARHSARWEQQGAFRCGQGSGKPFTIVIPPPNVTGSLHMGHALNNTLQDILIRYHRMKGRDALWQPGTDHAGIATQMVVERQLAGKGIGLKRGVDAVEGRSAADGNKQLLSRDEFIKKVWEWKEESGGTITRQLRRLGASVDWSRERFTMDEGLSAAVLKVFVDLYREGLIYKDKRLVNWDPKFHTAISDLEVEQREIKGSLWHINYPIDDAPGEFITVATTRPETMLGDTAVAVHPDDERWKKYVGKSAVLPLVGRRIPIVADEYSDPEKGTGAVKITPGHDFNDFGVGRRHNLDVINIFTADARIRLRGNLPFLAYQKNKADKEETNEFVHWTFDAVEGRDRFEARKLIVARLEERGFLTKTEPHTHTVPHGDRSGVPIEPYLTEQWYVNAQKLAEPAIAAVEQGKTVFVPEQWTKTYYHWMRNIEPWCVSRQLWWGHQIPAWYGRKLERDENGNLSWPSIEEDPEIFVATTEAEAVELARKKYGCEIRVLSTPPHGDLPKVYDDIINDEIDGKLRWEPIWRDPDVLDTWFSSGLWAFSTLGWPEQTPELKRYYPTDVLVTGFDIIFFWVARMMMLSLHFMKDVPFRQVYIHALVRDAKGQKMSKSKGNVMDPLELIDKFGTDALRFTLSALAVPGRDIKLSESRVEGYRNFATKLWNAARYAEMNDCTASGDFAFRGLVLTQTVNRWIAGELRRTAASFEEAVAAFRFNDAASALYKFVWGTFCDWYLEFTKPILQDQDDISAKTETRKMIGYVLRETLKLLHPIMPFITEELWARQGREDMLAVAAWPDLQLPIDPAADDEMNWVIDIVSELRSLRSEYDIKPSAQIQVAFQDATEGIETRVKQHEALIRKLGGVSTLGLVGATPSVGAIVIARPTATILVFPGEAIDRQEQNKKKKAAMEKLSNEIAVMDRRLNNPDFIAKADPDAVDDLRERRTDAEAARGRLATALQRLESL